LNTFLSHTCHMPRDPHSSWLDLVIIFGVEYKLWNSSLCNFVYSPLTSFLFGPNILLTTLFWNTPSLWSPLHVRDQVSHPCKTTSRIMVLFILTFTFWTSGGKTKDSEPKGSKHSPNLICS
jgi:hypothetical protein